MTLTALPITSARRFSPLVPVGVWRFFLDEIIQLIVGNYLAVFLDQDGFIALVKVFIPPTVSANCRGLRLFYHLS